MQRYNIIHLTHYHFSGVVSLGPHTLLLRPREGHDLRIESSTPTITPPGIRLVVFCRDIGNHCWVEHKILK
jgi:hypothetical protein